MPNKQKLNNWEEEWDKFQKCGCKSWKEACSNCPPNKTYKQFIQSLLSTEKEKILKEIDGIGRELLKEFANTPLDERKNGWEWIVKFLSEIKKSLNKLLE